MKKLTELFKKDREFSKQCFNYSIMPSNVARDLDVYLDNLDKNRPALRRISIPKSKMIGQV